jgi:nitric oxide reductase NorE protein
VATTSTSSRLRPRRLPGVQGVWVFIGADLVIFGILFGSFMHDRSQQSAVFESSRHTLNYNFGGINTVILLTSSWFVALAANAVRLDDLRRVPKLLAGGFACGFAFMVSKAIEYGEKLSAGISPKTDPFYMWYFTLTGIHLVHVIVGTVLLGVLIAKARRRVFHSENRVFLECVTSFWHLVDLLWIVLFPLLYLLR